MPYVRTKTAVQPRLNSLAPKIIEAYVKGRMAQVCDACASLVLLLCSEPSLRLLIPFAYRCTVRKRGGQP